MYLTTTAELDDLLRRARDVGRFGIDAEFIRERTYYPQLALVQISVEDTYVLVDPLGPVDLAPLDEAISDPDVIKVLHAGSQDLEIFYYRSEREPRNIFDTQLAAAMCGLGNQIAYGALVDRMLGVTLAKGESFTDWLRRPLTEKQERYALDDVVYLLPVHDALLARLDELGRGDWVGEEFRRYESRDFYVTPDANLYRKVKRFGTLDSRGQAVLRELAAWREADARKRDKPRRTIVADEALVEIARTRPKNEDALGRIRALRPQTVRQSAQGMLQAIADGVAIPDDECPRDEKRKRLPASAELVGDFLHAFLKSECQNASISTSMVGKSADVQNLVRAHLESRPTEHNPLVSGWRGDLVGRKLEAFLHGKVWVHVDPESLEPVFEERE